MGSDNVVIEELRRSLNAAAEQRMREIKLMLRDLDELASKADMKDARTLFWAGHMIRQLAGIEQ